MDSAVSLLQKLMLIMTLTGQLRRSQLSELMHVHV